MCAKVSEKDPRLDVSDIKYLGETGDINAHQARPKGSGKHPGVIVIQEIFGLNQHIKDVARRIAVAKGPGGPAAGGNENDRP